jgi:hypothetical protein
MVVAPAAIAPAAIALAATAPMAVAPMAVAPIVIAPLAVSPTCTERELAMSAVLTIITLAVVALVLGRDWGHRKVSWFALLRPLIGVIIIPFVSPGWDLSGAGLPLEVGGLVAGVALGLITAAFMKVSVDETGQAWTDTGMPYAIIWIAIAAVRLVLIYGTEHWFTQAVGSFLVNNHISVSAFADSIIFLAIAPVVANRMTILIRVRMTSADRRAAAPVVS